MATVFIRKMADLLTTMVLSTPHILYLLTSGYEVFRFVKCLFIPIVRHLIFMFIFFSISKTHTLSFIVNFPHFICFSQNKNDESGVPQNQG